MASKCIPSITEVPTAWRSGKGRRDVPAGDTVTAPSMLAAFPVGSPASEGPSATGRHPSPPAAASGNPASAVAALEGPALKLGGHGLRSGSGGGGGRAVLSKKRECRGQKPIMRIREVGMASGGNGANLHRSQAPSTPGAWGGQRRRSACWWIPGRGPVGPSGATSGAPATSHRRGSRLRRGGSTRRGLEAGPFSGGLALRTRRLKAANPPRATNTGGWTSAQYTHLARPWDA